MAIVNWNPSTETWASLTYNDGDTILVEPGIHSYSSFAWGSISTGLNTKNAIIDGQGATLDYEDIPVSNPISKGAGSNTLTVKNLGLINVAGASRFINSTSGGGALITLENIVLHGEVTLAVIYAEGNVVDIKQSSFYVEATTGMSLVQLDNSTTVDKCIFVDVNNLITAAGDTNTNTIYYNFATTPTLGAGSSTVDPQFIDGANGNLELRPSSPAKYLGQGSLEWWEVNAPDAWLDFNDTGANLGTINDPYQSVPDAIAGVSENAIVAVKQDQYFTAFALSGDRPSGDTKNVTFKAVGNFSNTICHVTYVSGILDTITNNITFEGIHFIKDGNQAMMYTNAPGISVTFNNCKFTQTNGLYFNGGSTTTVYNFNSCIFKVGTIPSGIFGSQFIENNVNNCVIDLIDNIPFTNYSNATQRLSIRNSIIYSEGVGVTIDYAPYLDNNNIWYGVTFDSGVMDASSKAVDPLFVDYAAGNYELRPTSPAKYLGQGSLEWWEVNAPATWLDLKAAGGGDGSYATPYNTFALAWDNTTTGDVIGIKNNTYSLGAVSTKNYGRHFRAETDGEVIFDFTAGGFYSTNTLNTELTGITFTGTFNGGTQIGLGSSIAATTWTFNNCKMLADFNTAGTRYLFWDGIAICNNCVIKKPAGANNLSSGIGNLSFYNCTLDFSLNQSIVLDDIATFSNGIFYGDGINDIYDLSVADNSCLYQMGATQTGTNIITTDPLFMDKASGNYELRPNSPCKFLGAV